MVIILQPEGQWGLDRRRRLQRCPLDRRESWKCV